MPHHWLVVAQAAGKHIDRGSLQYLGATEVLHQCAGIGPWSLLPARFLVGAMRLGTNRSSINGAGGGGGGGGDAVGDNMSTRSADAAMRDVQRA